MLWCEKDTGGYRKTKKWLAAPMCLGRREKEADIQERNFEEDTFTLIEFIKVYRGKGVGLKLG